jgi:membrane protein GlpM
MDFQIIIKSFIGFVVVFIIQLLSRSKYYVLSALVPLFPSMAIFSYYFVGKQGNAEKLQETIIFGMVSLITYFAFLLSLLIFSRYYKIVTAIMLASGVWFIFAIGQTLFWNYFKKPF